VSQKGRLIPLLNYVVTEQFFIQQSDFPGFTTHSTVEAPLEEKNDSWTKGIDEQVLSALPQSEIERQS
jgi:hypothetical protein